MRTVTYVIITNIYILFLLLLIITEYILFEAPPSPLRREETSSAELRRDRRKPHLFLVSGTTGTTKMRLTRSLYSLLVCSVVFSGGGLAAVGEEDDGSFHVNSWVVEVHAGEGHAAQLAERHGFIKHGQVRAPR